MTNVLSWVMPAVFLLWLYRDSFRIWFREDDFSLLAFVRQVHGGDDFFRVLFRPYAQGTIRPWSERLPFLLSWNLFGLDNLPFRIGVIATAMADTVLISWVARRITGSRLAGAAAAVFWAASAAIISPMTWNSSYNEVQYPLFLLGALALFIRYIETEQSRYWWAQLTVFALGFGSLENNVVYPAIAASWVIFVANKSNRKNLLAGIAPLFGISFLYVLIHMKVAPVAPDGLYAVRIDARIAATFWEYWRWAFLSPGWTERGFSRLSGLWIGVLAMGALVAFTISRIQRRDYRALFCLSWFLLTLAPMLPLPDRHTEYYLSAPVMGLAMLAGWGLSAAANASWIWRAAALVPALAWFTGMVPVVTVMTRRYVEESRLSRTLILAAQAARQTHPGKAILLDGITPVLYQVAIFEGGFRAAGIPEVYLTPGSAATVRPAPDDDDFKRMTIDPAVTLRALEQDRAVVYSFAGDHLRNITRPYGLAAEANRHETPQRVEVGNPLYSYLVGPEWFAGLNGMLWMPAAATVRIGGPTHPGQRLRIDGYCAETLLAKGPFRVALTADGLPLGEVEITAPETHFDHTFLLPDSLIGKGLMEVTIRVNPVEQVGGRVYGAQFGTISIER
jgi:hypothetical protein